MWLPCGLKVDPFPGRASSSSSGTCLDERSHRYLVTWGKRVEMTRSRAVLREIDSSGGTSSSTASTTTTWWRARRWSILRRGGRLAPRAPLPPRPDHHRVAQAGERPQPRHPAQTRRARQARVSENSPSPPTPAPGSPRYGINRAIMDLTRNPNARALVANSKAEFFANYSLRDEELQALIASRLEGPARSRSAAQSRLPVLHNARPGAENLFERHRGQK